MRYEICGSYANITLLYPLVLGQCLHHLLEFEQALLQLGVLLHQLLIQALNGGQGHARGVDRGDALAGLAQAEGGMKILGHRTEVPHPGVVDLVAPL